MNYQNLENNFLELILKSFSPSKNIQNNLVSFDEIMEDGLLDELTYDLEQKIILYELCGFNETFREQLLDFSNKGFITIDELKEIISEQYFYDEDKEFDYDKLENLISILSEEKIKLLDDVSTEKNILRCEKEIIAKLIINKRYTDNDPFTLYVRELRKIERKDNYQEKDDYKIKTNIELKFSLKDRFLKIINKIYLAIKYFLFKFSYLNKFKTTTEKTQTNNNIIIKDDYQNQLNLDEFNKILLDLKEEVIIQLNQDSFKHNYEILSLSADLNDIATALEEIERNSNLNNRSQLMLEEINQALLRIETKTFGYCKECNEEIGLERLKIIPTAQLCIDCQKLKER